MKPNVDLTANRDFSRRNITTGFDALDRLVFKLTSIPWKSHKLELLDKKDYSEVFPTGDKKLRGEKKRYHMYERYDEKICDRCGRTMYPWNESSLCYVCENDITGKHDHKSFFFKDNFSRLVANFGWLALDQIKTYD
ncbi:MAG: hypothetical protein ACRC23_01535 [Aeromonas jandaei]